MSKGKAKEAKKKLARAQRKLAELEGTLAVVQTESEERVQAARALADKRIAKAQKRVDRQMHVVAERETRLHAHAGHEVVAPEAATPEAAADTLGGVIAESPSANGATAPDGSEVPLIVPSPTDDSGNEPHF